MVTVVRMLHLVPHQLMPNIMLAAAAVGDERLSTPAIRRRRRQQGRPGLPAPRRSSWVAGAIGFIGLTRWARTAETDRVPPLWP